MVFVYLHVVQRLLRAVREADVGQHVGLGKVIVRTTVRYIIIVKVRAISYGKIAQKSRPNTW